MDASRASDPRGEVLIISLGWCSFRLDRVSVAPSAARALASRFPRLRGFPYLVVGSTLGHDADHGTPPLFDSAGYQGPGWPGWRWLQGLHRGWLRPQDVSVQSRILAYPRVGRPEIQVTGFSTPRSRVRFSWANRSIHSRCPDADLPSSPLPSSSTAAPARLATSTSSASATARLTSTSTPPSTPPPSSRPTATSTRVTSSSPRPPSSA